MIDYYFQAKMKFESTMQEKFINYDEAPDSETESEHSHFGNVSDRETRKLNDKAAILK